MRENRATVLRWIGLSEGGYVNNPKDPGGPTDRGITQKTFDAYNRSKGLPVRPVKGISKELADEIIARNYLDPVKFDELPAGLDYMVADFAVNSGVSRAVIELQRLLPGTKADGVIGDLTLDAVEGVKTLEILAAYASRRMSYLKGLRTWTTFGGGWTTRVMGKRDGGQVGDIGVLDRALELATTVKMGDTVEARQETAKAIPEPRIAAPGKGTDADRAIGTLVGKVLSDPVAVVPAIGTLAAPLVTGGGPVQWAIAAVVILVGVYALTRALRRSS